MRTGQQCLHWLCDGIYLFHRPIAAPYSNVQVYLHYSRSRFYILMSYWLFCCLKFRCHGNQGQSWQNSCDIIQQPDPENPVLDAKVSEISGIQAELQTISSQISLPQQRWLVVVEFFWHPSIPRPRKPAVGRKYLRIISYTSRLITDFVSNFVAMATGVGRGRICLA